MTTPQNVLKALRPFAVASVLLSGCGNQTKFTSSETRDLRLDRSTLFVVSLKRDEHGNDSPFAHSKASTTDSATLYYARFEIKPGASGDDIVAVATECKPLLTEPGYSLVYSDDFVSGDVPCVIRVSDNLIQACEIASSKWQTLGPRGAPGRFQWHFKPHNRSGTRMFSDGVVLLDGQSGRYVFEGDFLTQEDYALMVWAVRDNHPRMTESGEEIVYQRGGGRNRDEHNECYVAERDGTRLVLASPLDATLLAADRVQGALTLVLGSRWTTEICVWNTETGQVWRHQGTQMDFEAWDPQTGEVILSDARHTFQPEQPTSDFILWHYREEQEQRGHIEWPAMLRSP